jgi:myo-inositol-1(or 4)-monophosphatase
MQEPMAHAASSGWGSQRFAHHRKKAVLMSVLEIAVRAVKEAAKVTQRQFGKPRSVEYKAGEEAVTKADIEAERKIREILGKHFPEHSILGEEEGQDSSSDCLWLIDPIDGTVNYSRGIRLYGISLAMARNRKPVLGVVCNPLSGELFTAERGKGAYMNGEKIRVSSRTELSKSVVYATELFKSKKHVEGLFEKVKNFRITSSSAYETCLVACGRTEAFVKITSHPWGFAAASLIVEEAGGKVTNFDGTRWSIDSTKLLASNGLLHEEILALLGK